MAGCRRGDRRHNLVFRIGLGTRRQVPAHAEGKFQFRHLHQIVAQHAVAAIGDHPLGQEAPRQRAVHADMLLAGGAGGGDLPAIKRLVGIGLDAALHRISFGAFGGPQILGQVFQPRALPPVAVEQIAGGLLLVRFHRPTHR